MLSTFTSYQLIAKDLQKSLTRTANDPVIARETKYYLENIKNVKSVDELLGNHRLYTYAMKAHGLEDMTYAKAFMKKILNEGIDSSDSFANRLSDSRYQDFAKAFNFSRYGDLTTTFSDAQQSIVDKYLRQSLEETAGTDDPGVRLALYFERKAGDIKNPYDILADTALLEVFQTALGIPKEAAQGNIDAQAAMITKRLDLDSLKEPEGLARFLRRFTSMWDAQNNAASAPVLTLFTGASASSGMNVDLLMSLQRVKLGS